MPTWKGIDSIYLKTRALRVCIIPWEKVATKTLHNSHNYGIQLIAFAKSNHLVTILVPAS